MATDSDSDPYQAPGSDNWEIPRNPHDYRPDPGGHFRRRMRERDIPGAVIEKAIRGGEVKPDDASNEDYVALETTYLGYDWQLIVDPERQHVITAVSPDGWHD